MTGLPGNRFSWHRERTGAILGSDRRPTPPARGNVIHKYGAALAGDGRGNAVMQVAGILKAKGHVVVTTRPEATVAEVARLLKRERIGAAVVTDEDGNVAGIISERDLVRALPDHGAAVMEKRAAELMTRPVVTCAPEDTIEDVMRKMTDGRFRHLPVLEDGKLAGIVSIGDVVKNRMDELESETTLLRQYIASG